MVGKITAFSPRGLVQSYSSGDSEELVALLFKNIG